MRLTMRDQDYIDKGIEIGRTEAYAKAYEEGLAEARAEDIIEVLSFRWTIPDSLKTEIMKQTNIDILDKWLDFSLSSQSLAEFRDKMKTV